MIGAIYRVFFLLLQAPLPCFRPPPYSFVNSAARGGYSPPYPLFGWIMGGGCYPLSQESSEWEIMEEIFFFVWRHDF
ncbi:hypothetical protein L195_g053350 [Trifolium pratense]|uniref:Secreted protein n=1 Tax=Trifolium pratense TaxID=57577 RepID=A0A2K3KA38_TRIPR|nr:hypothetical protein L195_g053350 [Trifolium pratense]